MTKNNDIIQIDKSEIAEFATVGEKLALRADAEEALVKLLDLKDYIDRVVDDVKEQIAVRGQELYPDFKGVVGEKIKAIYRSYGDKYETDNPEFKKEIVSYRTDGGKIDSYLEENGKLPEGVQLKQRTKKLIITRT